MAEVDLQKIQDEYELMQKMFNGWSADLDNAKERVARISAGKGEPGLREYHERTLQLLDKTLDRMQDIYDKMVEAGAASLTK